MNRKITVLTLCAMLLAFWASAEAQQTTKIPRIGYLAGSSPSAISARIEVFRQGLRELGYVEGKNITIDYRWSEGKAERLPALAAELAAVHPDVIFTGSPQAVFAAKKATATIPIVFVGIGDPVGMGIVSSLARPGGNITGSSTLVPELSGKRLELLKEIVPRLSRVVVFGTSTQPDNTQMLKEVELAAGTLGVKLQYLDVLSLKDVDTAF